MESAADSVTSAQVVGQDVCRNNMKRSNRSELIREKPLQTKAKLRFIKWGTGYDLINILSKHRGCSCRD